jgi:hypothetical protein
MIRTYILNRNSRVVHLMLDAKTDERCNVDAIKAKSVFTGEGGRADVEHLFWSKHARPCKRCYR